MQIQSAQPTTQPTQVSYKTVFLSEGWTYIPSKDLYCFLEDFFLEGSIVRDYMKMHSKPDNRIHLVDSLNRIYREFVVTFK